MICGNWIWQKGTKGPLFSLLYSISMINELIKAALCYCVVAASQTDGGAGLKTKDNPGQHLWLDHLLATENQANIFPDIILIALPQCSDLDPVCFFASVNAVCLFLLPSPFVTSKSNMATGARTTPFSPQASFLITTGVGWNRRTTRGKMKGFFILVRSFQNSPKDPFLSFSLELFTRQARPFI